MAIESIVIGFGYRARSGKDTAVAEIIEQRGLAVEDCKIPPAGWRCTRSVGHEGPCAAWESEVERYDIRKYAFADALRSEVEVEAHKAGGIEKLFAPNYCFPKKGYVMTLPEWVKFDPNGEVNEQYPLGKQRTLLQWWGTEYRRVDDDNYWVKRLAERIELEKPEIALVTDMRFPNEVAFCKEHGEIVKVDRPGLPESTHASETALAHMLDEEWSIILENGGSLEEFLLGAVTCFDELMVNFP